MNPYRMTMNMNAAANQNGSNATAIQSERRATERTFLIWNDYAERNNGDFVSNMLNEHWDEDSFDFLLVYDCTSPEHSSIVIAGTGAQNFLGLPSSRFPAAQRLPESVREQFLTAAGRAIANGAPARKCGTYFDKFGNEVLYRSIFIPTKSGGDCEPICVYGTFAAKFVDNGSRH